MSKFSLQSPYVVATLPKPIDRENGRYVVGEVFGGAPGQKKRKRSELAVGIDGEGVNIYDISSSRLIASYALPPQSSFTCAPTSLRTRVSKINTSRRTYASTTGTQSQITLFKDDVDGTSGNKSTSNSRVFACPKNPIVFTSTTAATFDPNAALGSTDILVVKRDGEICCLDGETLEDKWISPASTLLRAQNGGKEGSAEVEYAVLSSAFAVSQGIFKGSQDIFSIFPQEVSEDGFNPDILVLVSKDLWRGVPSSRWLHIITFPRRSSAQINGHQHSVQPLLSAKFPTDSHPRFKNTSIFGISIPTGILQQLHDNILSTFVLTELGPRVQSTLSLGSAKSFLRLSNTSILVSNEAMLSVYNPKFQSILSSIEVENVTEKDSLKRKRGDDDAEKGTSLVVCSLATYLPKLSVAVAVVGNDLVAIQIEGNQDRKGKSRTTGLLIDSLGCAAPKQMRSHERISKFKNLDSETLSTYLPSSLNSSGPFADRIQNLVTAFSAGDVSKFDERMMKKLKPSRVEINGAQPDKPHQRDPLAVDRRMIMYSLSKIFERNESGPERKLTISFYAPKTFLWLIKNGHMTISNIQTALKQHHIPAPELVLAICEINPDMDLLLALIGNNYVEATGLVCAIRALMDSLGLLGEASRNKQRLLTSGEENQDAGGVEEQLENLEAEAENDLSFAEYQLESGSSVRGQALSLALSKLYSCSTTSIIYAFQTILSSQEVVCLIYLLRFELAGGGWTDKYLDTDPETNEEEPGVTDNAIILIASLLGNCIDAVGAGGWLSGDTKLIRSNGSEAEDLISSLKFEVSAALEAIEEGTYLKGITSEMVRYGNTIQNALSENSEARQKIPAKKKQKKSKPMALQTADPEEALLPLGLKAERHISKLRVGAGGEVQTRTKRDIGNLISQRVGKYTFERITI